MAAHRVRCADQSGFTIAEYITAVAILMTVVIGALSALMYAGTASAGTARREEALNLANKQIELARNQPYDNLGTSWPGTNPVTQGDYTIDTLVSWGRDENNRATCRVVHVTVSWQTPRPGQVDVETRIFGKSEVSNTGDVLVNVVEGLSGGGTQPLSGVLVTLVPSLGGTQRVNTDGEGGAFFGHVGAGSFTFTGARSGYIVDHSAYPTPPTVTAGSTTTCQVTAYKPSSYRFTFDCPGQPSVPAVDVNITGSKPNPLATKVVNGNETLFDDLLPDNYMISFGVPTGYQVADGTATNFSISEPNTDSGVTVHLVKNTLFVVTVNDDRGEGYPVAGATVTLSGPANATATTDSSGRATFTITTSGTYGVVANKTEYIGATGTKALTVGTDDTASLDMTRYGTLSCYYSSANTKKLYVYDVNKNLVTSGTTSSKRISFDLPPADYYYVSIKSSWSSTAKKSTELLPGQTTNLTLSSSN